jgi:hypothetical protein
LTGALRAIVADMTSPPPRPRNPEIESLIEDLSALVHFPSAPDSSSSPQATDRGTLWQNGEDFKAKQFREKLGKIAELRGGR